MWFCAVHGAAELTGRVFCFSSGPPTLLLTKRYSVPEKRRRNAHFSLVVQQTPQRRWCRYHQQHGRGCSNHSVDSSDSSTTRPRLRVGFRARSVVFVFVFVASGVLLLAYIGRKGGRSFFRPPRRPAGRVNVGNIGRIGEVDRSFYSNRRVGGGDSVTEGARG